MLRLQWQRQRGVGLADGCQGSLEHFDRTLRPIAHVIRLCQPTAGADQHTVIVAGCGESLLEMRDRVRLSRPPLRDPQQEQSAVRSTSAGGSASARRAWLAAISGAPRSSA